MLFFLINIFFSEVALVSLQNKSSMICIDTFLHSLDLFMKDFYHNYFNNISYQLVDTRTQRKI